MLENEFHISRLLAGYLQGTLNAAEENEFQLWLKAQPRNPAFLDSFLEDKALASELDDYFQTDKEDVWLRIKSGLLSDPPIQKPSRNIKLWMRISIAATIAAIAFGVWFYSPGQYINNNHKIAVQNDIPPGKQGATLTLANGKTINLSNLANGEVTKEAGMKISKGLDGQLTYVATNTRKNPVRGRSASAGPAELMNVLSTAKGETYKVRLPDSSLVWLNAASSLTYAITLNESKIREVKLEGEGYFEVKKNKLHPFIVESKGQKVEVLGTHFNVNAYDEDDDIKTTLLEGSVRIHYSDLKPTKGREIILKPMQQASINSKSEVIVKPVDVNEAVAWKNGYFRFNDEDLESIMRKLSRWYNINVEFIHSPSKEGFNGKISRYKSITQVLKMLEETDAVHFKVKGRQVSVTSK